MDAFPEEICNDIYHPFPRQYEGHIFRINCTGGFLGAEKAEDRWVIGPVFEDGEARLKGYLTRRKFEKLLSLGGYEVLGFQSAGWINGERYSSWNPIIPGQKNNSRSPAAIWSAVSSNLFRASDRFKRLKELDEIDHATASEILDERSMDERLAQSISLSLRSIDLAVAQIAEHYNEQLVNHMNSGKLDGQRNSNTLDQNLFAHVHSFFLQLGSARDYLAALIAHRLGMNAEHGKIDTMDALKKKLRTHHVGKDAILDLLIDNKWFEKMAGKKDLWTTSGWLKEVTDLRNEFVHRRPYGSRYAERFGWAAPVRRELGLFRYFRPIVVNGEESDLLDIISFHYRACTKLFFDAVQAPRLDGSMIMVTNKDIRSK